jgi:hypothetical protein
MVDYRYITAVPSNFNYEEVLAKNQIYKTENKNLKVLLENPVKLTTTFQSKLTTISGAN